MIDRINQKYSLMKLSYLDPLVLTADNTKSRTPSAAQFKVIKRHYELKDERLIIKNRDKSQV